MSKNLNLKRDKLFLSVFSVALALYMSFSCTYFSASAEGVRESVVRLHILANSDSAEDQQVKLKVRDALLRKNTSLLTEGVNTENAREYFENSKDELLKTAQAVLKENGFDYGVRITLEKEYFETRKYGDLTFPAGEYMALRVVLGKGEGHNWWCVMFPPLCVPAADGIETDEKNTADYFPRSGEELINGGRKYVIKFKVLEIFEEIKSKIK